jgi:hypothetical protein
MSKVALITFICTNSELDTGELAEVSGFFCVIPIVNAAVLSELIFLVALVLRLDTKFESVVVLCFSALGGLLPLVSVGMGFFLGRAIQLAVDHGDPSLPYLKAAVYQLLFEDSEVWSVKLIAWLAASMSLIGTAWYIYWMIVLLSKVSRRGNRALATLAIVCVWLFDGLVVTPLLHSVFWRLMIRQAASHHD